MIIFNNLTKLYLNLNLKIHFKINIQYHKD